MNVKRDIVGEYYSRIRPFSFRSSLDCVTTVIALLDLWLKDFKDSKEFNCPVQKKIYSEVFSVVESLKNSL